MMTIRFRLSIAFLAVILVANSILSILAVAYVSRVALDEVQDRVQLGLSAAREAYAGQIRGIEGFLEAISIRQRVSTPITEALEGDLGELLQAVCHEGDMDMLALLDAQGRVLYRAHRPEAAGDDLSGDPIVARALERWSTSSGTVSMSREQLLREGEALATRAMATGRREAGILIAAAVPLADLYHGSRALGLLYGAKLLNGRYAVVDAINDTVFQQQTHRGRSVGSVTVFQDDVRVATNVLGDDGERAVGTRMSAPVRSRVLDQGEPWYDRSFVVNDWYLTAYAPLRDPAGRVIGAVSVGLLEAPFTRPQKLIESVFLALVALTTIAMLIILGLVTRRVLGPIGRIVAMSRRIAAGDLSARVGIRPRGELGVLCQAVDRMADAVAEREEQLTNATRRQLGQSEKLASIGRLAAGIAHEINNPLTGVLTFAHLLKHSPHLDSQERDDIEVIVRETTRVRDIVKGLLDFAREMPLTKAPLSLSAVIRQVIQLVRSQKDYRRTIIHEELAEPLSQVVGDKNQLQQVVLNLLLNACEAMPEGGVLTVTCEPEGADVVLRVSDTGLGIPEENLERIFDPFFTTKPPGKGTGLGLSVTYGIVQQHGGSIEVTSREGRGSTFTVRLPLHHAEAAVRDQAI